MVDHKLLRVLSLMLFLGRHCNTQGIGKVEGAFATTQPALAGSEEDSNHLHKGHGHHPLLLHHSNSKGTRRLLLQSSAKYITVGKQGNTDFDSVRDAVDAVPENNADWVEISIRAGVYRYGPFLGTFHKPLQNFLLLQLQFIYESSTLGIESTNKLTCTAKRKESK